MTKRDTTTDRSSDRDYALQSAPIYLDATARATVRHGPIFSYATSALHANHCSDTRAFNARCRSWIAQKT